MVRVEAWRKMGWKNASFFYLLCLQRGAGRELPAAVRLDQCLGMGDGHFDNTSAPGMEKSVLRVSLVWF